MEWEEELSPRSRIIFNEAVDIAGVPPLHPLLASHISLPLWLSARKCVPGRRRSLSVFCIDLAVHCRDGGRDDVSHGAFGKPAPAFLAVSRGVWASCFYPITSHMEGSSRHSRGFDVRKTVLRLTVLLSAQCRFAVTLCDYCSRGSWRCASESTSSDPVATKCSLKMNSARG